MARSWKAKRARVAVVEHDEVEHRRRLELAEIAGAVGDRAVAELERQPHRGVPVDRRLGEGIERAGQPRTARVRAGGRDRGNASPCRASCSPGRGPTGWRRSARSRRGRPAADRGCRAPPAGAGAPRPSAGRRPSIMSAEKRSRMRAGQALDGVEHRARARCSSEATAARPLLEGGASPAPTAPRPRSIRLAWLSRRPSRRSSIASRGLDGALGHLVAVVRSRRASLSSRSM